jgi:hypothetical protein
MASTVAGLGTLAYLSSISYMNNYFASTVNGLGTYGIISSSLLTSSMQGLSPPYVSSTWLTSTMQGLGTLGYVSYSQFNSSIIGITLWLNCIRSGDLWVYIVPVSHILYSRFGTGALYLYFK